LKSGLTVRIIVGLGLRLRSGIAVRVNVGEKVGVGVRIDGPDFDDLLSRFRF